MKSKIIVLLSRSDELLVQNPHPEAGELLSDFLAFPRINFSAYKPKKFSNLNDLPPNI